MKASSEFLDYTIVSQSSEDSEYPSSNLKEYESSTESFRTTTTGSDQNIVIDLGSAVSGPHIIIYGCNFTSLTIQGNSSDSWTSPPFDENYTVEKDPELQIYKIKVDLSTFNYRYLRIVIPTQTPTDNASHFEIGVVGIFTTLETFEDGTGGFGFPLDMEVTRPEQINRYATGRKDIISLFDTPVITFTLSGNFSNSVSIRNKIADVFMKSSNSVIMIDRTNENSWQAYLVQRTGQSSLSELKSGNSGARRTSIVLETIL